MKYTYNVHIKNVNEQYTQLYYNYINVYRLNNNINILYFFKNYKIIRILHGKFENNFC